MSDLVGNVQMPSAGENLAKVLVQDWRLASDWAFSASWYSQYAICSLYPAMRSVSSGVSLGGVEALSRFPLHHGQDP